MTDKNIGFIGLGNVGSKLAYSILQQGDYNLFVYDKNKSTSTKLVKKGAIWKNSIKEIVNNKDEFVKEITAIALNAKEERLRIEILTLLDGVGWPTASVILHFYHKEPYPILDFRALWSLGIAVVPKQYEFQFWWRYVEFCRSLFVKYDVSNRTLDKALWQYSKENQ
mgnify:CR=1 FL=1